jgi:hypothetical protein
MPTWEISTCSGRIPQVEIENNKIITQKSALLLIPRSLDAYLIPQSVPGRQDGTGNALALAVIVVVVVEAVFVASMWSAANPVTSRARTNARTAIFTVIVL